MRGASRALGSVLDLARSVTAFRVLLVAVIALGSAGFSWIIMTKFGILSVVLALVGLTGVCILSYVSKKDLSFVLMFWLLSMGGFRVAAGIVSMPGLPDFSFDRVLLVWIIMMFGVRVVIERMKMPGPYKADFFILGHSIYVLVQLHMVESIHMHHWVMSSLSPLFGYLYGRYIIRNPSEVRNLLLFFVVYGFYFGIVAIAEKYNVEQLIWPKQILDPNAGALWQPGRSRGPVMHPPLNGQLMGMMLLIMFVFLVKARALFARVLSIVNFIVLGLGLLFAYTRGPWLATSAALGILGMLRPSFRKVLIYLGIAVILMGALGANQILESDFLKERLENQQTIQNRLMFLSASLKMIRDYPIFGLGFFKYNDYRDFYHQGTYIPFYGYVSKHYGKNMVIHDIYLGRFAEEGLVSILLLLGFSVNIIRAFWHKWRNQIGDPWFDRDTMAVFAAMMVCYHIGGMVIDYRYFDLVNVMYFLFAGIIYGYRNEDYGFGVPLPRHARRPEPGR